MTVSSYFCECIPWVCTCELRSPHLHGKQFVPIIPSSQLGLVFQKLDTIKKEKIGCLHTIRKETHLILACMGVGADRPRLFLCPLLLMSPAEGIASLNITFFVYQVRTTAHNSYSFEDMT